MIRVRDLKNGLFQVHQKNGQAFEGSPKAIFAKAMEWGVKEKELAAAVQQMHLGEGTYADFGDDGRLKVVMIDKKKK